MHAAQARGQENGGLRAVERHVGRSVRCRLPSLDALLVGAEQHGEVVPADVVCAAEVKRATDDQVQTGAGIAQGMEQIAADVRVIRDRLGRQLAEAEQIASATRATLTIAKKNNAIAEQFSAAIEDLVVSGKVFSEDVSRFRV